MSADISFSTSCLIFDVKDIQHNGQKIKLSIKNLFSKCDQIRTFLRIWSHLLAKFLVKNFIFCAVVILAEENTWNFIISIYSH